MFCTSWLILGSVFARAIVRSLSTSRRFRCLVLIKTRAEKPVSHMEIEEKGTSIRKAREAGVELTGNLSIQSLSNVKRWKSYFMDESAFISKKPS
ncbi:unnamed protein product [Acanthoscelides obtectus]|uniref:Uncharacterized protein n=1 Tax=Acanthoscelides obtectus TaxID=200917 RepID=A0A9P0M3M9_ACAOB|nr:unnamed protein product [Acanthoscelides obtectus]CAK1628401.1 hypothetical protein AOBTE_LOCUS5187 [Acanthoscelides obtectus]